VHTFFVQIKAFAPLRREQSGADNQERTGLCPTGTTWKCSLPLQCKSIYKFIVFKIHLTSYQCWVDGFWLYLSKQKNGVSNFNHNLSAK